MSMATALQQQHHFHGHWCKKGLAFFHRKKQRSNYYLPTVMAAATEKYVRHRPSSVHDPYPHSHSRQMLTSEDLTASQFAILTGIKIKKIGKYQDPSFYLENEDDSSDDDGDDDEELNDDHLSLPMTIRSERNYASSSSLSSHTMPHKPRIWDSNFWHSPHGSTVTTPLHSRCSSSTMTTSSSMPLSSSHTMKSRSPNVIQKGRFQIMIGQIDHHPSHPITTPEKNVVEWKRKRSLTH
ncbi:uncharacterized protein BYT42DRAFT_563116 [Radiomyces spectabilis]|uniref:uncharacterized protein n=1 Tax=Radiomyces spectabilis TaxID=64574 RepID=UPI00221FE898|nr:uncharacterized protein BYT42DRAFT_563116 [Radiomyces spectabilis]KAI8384622.1 hypothetical protein BYT42DRAFT_563116 [Radiomyces spectabilis]